MAVAMSGVRTGPPFRVDEPESRIIMQTLKSIITHQVTLALLIFCIAAVLRLAYLNSAEIDTPIRVDAEKYLAIAVNLVERGVYSFRLDREPQPDAFITPGYPLYLAAFWSVTRDVGRTYTNALLGQGVLSAATAAIVLLLGCLFLPRWAASIAGLLTALSPHMTSMSGYLLTETLFTFLLCLSLYLLVLGLTHGQRWFIFVAGLLIGLGALVRPAYLLFPVTAGFIVLFDQRETLMQRVANWLIMLLAIGLLWAPWAIWKSDKPSSVNNAAASFALGTYPNLVYKDERLRGVPYREDPAYGTMSASMEKALAMAKDRAAAEPFKYLRWYLIGKPMTFWTWDILVGQGGPFVYPVLSSIYHTHHLANFSLAIYKRSHPYLILLAMVGIVFAVWQWRREGFDSQRLLAAGLVIVCVLYFTFVHMVFAPLPRYSIPMHPLLYLLAMFGVYRLLLLRGPTQTARPATAKRG